MFEPVPASRASNMAVISINSDNARVSGQQLALRRKSSQHIEAPPPVAGMPGVTSKFAA